MEAVIQNDLFGYVPEADASPSPKEMLQKLSSLVDSKGMLIPVKLAALILDVSVTRVFQLLENGKVERVECFGHVFVTENSLLAYASSERKAGRPFNTPKNPKECWSRAKKLAEK